MWSSVIDLIDLSPSRKERRMSGLIRKTDALDILCKFCGITEDVEKCRKTSADGWCKEYCELKNMPTMDAVPVRHGKWVIGTVPYFVCSECKSRTPLRWDERLGYVLDYQSPYCPYCGAKMDGAERKEE